MSSKQAIRRFYEKKLSNTEINRKLLKLPAADFSQEIKSGGSIKIKVLNKTYTAHIDSSGRVFCGFAFGPLGINEPETPIILEETNDSIFVLRKA